MGFNYYEAKQEFLNRINAVVTNEANAGRKLSLTRLELALNEKYPFARTALIKALERYERVGILSIDIKKDEIIIFSNNDGSKKE